MEIDQEIYEKLKMACDKLVESLRKIAQVFMNAWKWIKEKVIELYQLEEERPASIRNYHKFIFTRQKVHHQVIERKPRHLIKKIIR